VIENFQLAVIRFTLRAEAAIELPVFSGSTFRGAFGAMFRRIACTPACPNASACILASHCAYARVFEARPSKEGYQIASEGGLPRPFIIHPPAGERRAIAAGERFSFQMVLVGLAIEYLPYFILTWRELGQVGIGRGRGHFKLEMVQSCLPAESSSKASAGIDEIIYSSTDEMVHNRLKILTAERLLANPRFAVNRSNEKSRLRLELLTPMRLKYREQMLRDEVPFHVLVGALFRRLESLSFFYCGGSLKLDYSEMIRRAKEVQVVSSDLRWVQWKRYSRRQDRRIPWGGLLGRVEYKGSFAFFLPLLTLGEVVGVGNNCTFGLGRYEAHLKGEE
jgi:hypothetical protein